MKELYVSPLAEVVSFAPTQAIALKEPGWGWEDDVFGSDPEPKMVDEDEAAEGSGIYEG